MSHQLARTKKHAATLFSSIAKKNQEYAWGMLGLLPACWMIKSQLELQVTAVVTLHNELKSIENIELAEAPAAPVYCTGGKARERCA